MNQKIYYFVFELRGTDLFLTLVSFQYMKKNKFSNEKLRDHSALSIARLGTMFHEQFSSDNLVIYTSPLEKLIKKSDAEVLRILNTWCPLRTKQYSIYRLLNPRLTDELIRLVKLTPFLVTQVKGT